MQKYIDCFGGIIAPSIFYSDVTSLSNNGKVTGYPLVLSLGNVTCELQSEEEDHMLLVMLPMISALSISSHEWRLHIFHKCLRKILEPLK
jgi:hypothetical protein